MRTLLALCLALALAAACGKGSEAAVPGGLGPGTIPVAAPRDGGVSDAGTDGGTDAGTDGGTDGGCAGSLARPILVGFDHCAAIPGRRTAQIQDVSCNAIVFLDNTATCSGRISGDKDAFAGTCHGFSCTSGSIPGALNCDDGTDGGCAIDLCAAVDDPLCL
jgi:hypothetical protein